MSDLYSDGYDDPYSEEENELYDGIDPQSEGISGEHEPIKRKSIWRNWLFWLFAFIGSLLIFYIIYMHSLDQKERNERYRKYALHGRDAHLNTIISLPHGHLAGNQEDLHLPDSVQFSSIKKSD